MSTKSQHSTFRAARNPVTTRSKPAAQRYQFPTLVVNDDRSELITQMIPGLVSQRAFHLWGVIDGIKSAVDSSKSDTKLYKSMLEALARSKIKGVVDLKIFLLKFGLSEEQIHKKVKKSWDYFKNFQPAKKKGHIIGLLSHMRRSHYLVLVDLKEFWSSLVTVGCFRKLVKKSELVSLIEFGKYKDISEFISHRLASYDWEQHCPNTPQVDEAAIERKAGSDLRKSMSLEMRARTYQCIVCFDPIKAEQEFWQCGGCYRVVHLKCLQEWHTASGKSDCPTCRTHYHPREIRYTCWCKRVHSPRVDLLFPGSCGRVCGSGVTDPPSKCKLKCHPGPHSADG